MPRIIERPIYYKLKPSWGWELYARRVGTSEEVRKSAESLLAELKETHPKARVRIGELKKRRSG